MEALFIGLSPWSIFFPFRKGNIDYASIRLEMCGKKNLWGFVDEYNIVHPWMPSLLFPRVGAPAWLYCLCKKRTV